MNLRERIESITESHFRCTVEQWSKEVDNTWNFRANAILAIDHLIRLKDGEATDKYRVRYGFITGNKHVKISSNGNMEQVIILHVSGSDYAMIVPAKDFEYYEGIAKSLRHRSAKATSSVRFRVPSPNGGRSSTG